MASVERKFLWGFVPALLGIGLPFLMEVGPDEAIINLCKWPRKALPSLAENCLPGLSASQVYVAAITLLAIGIIWLTRPYRQIGTRRHKMAVGIALLCFSIVVGIWGLSIIASGSQSTTVAANSSSAAESPTTNPTSKSGGRRHILEGLVKARDDLLQIKKDELSCQALTEWQARADTATRLAHADGIGVHNPISQYIGSCQRITDVDLLNDIRASIVQLLNQGIQSAGG
jgi:hypothetical protein